MTVDLPKDGYTTTGKLQTQAGWWCLEIECTVTDSARNVFRRCGYINTGVPMHEKAPKVDAALIKVCGDKFKCVLQQEVSDAERARAVAEKQVEIDKLTAERETILSKTFDLSDGFVGVRKS